jgi:cytochrome c peroxidase
MKKFIFSIVLLTSVFNYLKSSAKSSERAAVEKIFRAKCMDCHSNETNYPWYFNLPVAKDIIQADIRKGRTYLDLQEDLFDYKNDKDIPKHVIARLEKEIRRDNMPPIQYKLAHWDKIINPEEKTQILDWLSKLNGKFYEPLKQVQGLDSEKIQLGDILYHDTRLSGDLTISCASCHDLMKGGTDQAQYSTGIDGQLGGINSPTVFNSVYNIRQFWDGRAADLEEQAHGPVHNPMEMGSNWDQVLERLRADSDLVARFKKVFAIRNSIQITGDMVANSIAEFEKSLVTTGDRFDQYLAGDKLALTEQEIHGYKLFRKNKCIACHNGPALGGASFEKMGVVNNYFKDREAGKNGLTKLALSEADDGLYNFSKNENDRYKFKVPVLRNIEKTFPYFHDGNVATLEEAVKHMAYYQAGRKLSPSDTDDIVAFLKTLTVPSLQGSQGIK